MVTVMPADISRASFPLPPALRHDRAPVIALLCLLAFSAWTDQGSARRT
jgi:hypothetical protein